MADFGLRIWDHSGGMSMNHLNWSFTFIESRGIAAGKSASRVPRPATLSAALILVSFLILVSIAPLSFSSPNAADSPHRYEDGRLGEKKDESDKFKFVRIK